jgi:cell division protein FtsZ
MFEEFNNIDLEVTTPNDWKRSDQIIKVIGVGGGGCNAVSYMYRTGIEGCSLVVCNTDSQALERSPVPVKIQMGAGLGAGTNVLTGEKVTITDETEVGPMQTIVIEYKK